MDLEPAGRREPDPRPLGVLAVALGAFAVLLAYSYVYSVLSFVVAALAAVLGRGCRDVPTTRALGTAAVVAAVVAVVVAVATLIRY